MIQLPTLEELVASLAQGIAGFVTDQNVGIPVTGSRPTTTVHLWTTSASSVNWQADADYFLIDVTSDSGSFQWMLTRDGTTYTQNWGAAGSGKLGQILAVPATNNSQSRQPQKTLIRTGDVLTFSNNSNTNAGILMILELRQSDI